MTDDEPLLSGVELDHVEVFVPDRATAVGWYARVFGLAPLEQWARWATPRGPLMLAPGGTLPSGGSMVALFERQPCRQQGRGEHHRVAFRVGGAAFLAFVAHAVSGPVYDEAGERLQRLVPQDHDGAFSVYFCDPWGNRCELTTYEWQHVAARLALDDASATRTHQQPAS